jgi:hypothetical protein
MDEARFLTMSRKELNRLEILGRVLERRLTQVQAAEQLGLGVRQVERLCRKLRVEGAPANRCTSVACDPTLEMTPTPAEAGTNETPISRRPVEQKSLYCIVLRKAPDRACVRLHRHGDVLRWPLTSAHDYA